MSARSPMPASSPLSSCTSSTISSISWRIPSISSRICSMRGLPLVLVERQATRVGQRENPRERGAQLVRDARREQAARLAEVGLRRDVHKHRQAARALRGGVRPEPRLEPAAFRPVHRQRGGVEGSPPRTPGDPSASSAEAGRRSAAAAPGPARWRAPAGRRARTSVPARGRRETAPRATPAPPTAPIGAPSAVFVTRTTRPAAAADRSRSAPRSRRPPPAPMPT